MLGCASAVTNPSFVLLAGDATGVGDAEGLVLAAVRHVVVPVLRSIRIQLSRAHLVILSSQLLLQVLYLRLLVSDGVLQLQAAGCATVHMSAPLRGQMQLWNCNGAVFLVAAASSTC